MDANYFAFGFPSNNPQQSLPHIPDHRTEGSTDLGDFSLPFQLGDNTTTQPFPPPNQHHTSLSSTYSSGSLSAPYSDLLGTGLSSFSHSTNSFPSFQPSTSSSHANGDPNNQLEVLREMRRIRELELAIHEEKRRLAEELRKQREAEVTLAQFGLYQSSTGSGLSIIPAGASASGSSSVAFGTPSHYNQPLNNPLPTFNDPPDPPSHHTSDASPPSLETSSTTANPSSSASPEPSSNVPREQSQPQSKKTLKKKKDHIIVEEHDAKCKHCSKTMAKLILRGLRNELDVPYQIQYECVDCVAVFPRTISKKRTNQFEDTTLPTTCVVCTRIQGQGGFMAKGRGPLSFTVETICVSCFKKYKRCSNCGGGAGGYGKWRCKELFEGNRKTCTLSHASLNARDMEMAVWSLPDQTKDAPELPDLLEIMQKYWEEHMISKLAIPEVLEHSPGLSTFEDIRRNIIDVGFMGRSLFSDPPMSPNHRLYVALTWAKQRARRDKSKPEWKRKEGKTTDEWVAFNTRWTTSLMPDNAIPSAMWLLEWAIPNRTLNLSTLYPFDYGEIGDRYIFSYISMLRPILEELEEHNAKSPTDPWLPPQHLWCSVKVNPYALRLRTLEFVQRKLNFMPLEEYLALHPDIDAASLFHKDAGNIARCIDARPSIDGHHDMSIYAKSLGPEMTLENVKRIMEMELNKVPKRIDV